MTTPWHMARVASRRQLPKPRKMHGPVGERMDTTQVESVHANSRAGKQCWYGTENGDSAVTACNGCGYHVCSCKPVERIEMFGVNANPAIIPKWRDARPGSVDVAGLEKLRAERFTEYHLRKAAEREF